MRVWRGLFRLWLVLSAVWITFVVWDSWPDLQLDMSSLKYWAVVWASPPYGDPPPDADKKYPLGADGEITNPWVLKEVIWDGVSPAAVAAADAGNIAIQAFGSPVAMLAFGFALGWAFSGFRNDKGQERP